jgi:hypothetical protein
VWPTEIVAGYLSILRSGAATKDKSLVARGRWLAEYGILGPASHEATQDLRSFDGAQDRCATRGKGTEEQRGGRKKGKSRSSSRDLPSEREKHKKSQVRIH